MVEIKTQIIDIRRNQNAKNLNIKSSKTGIHLRRIYNYSGEIRRLSKNAAPKFLVPTPTKQLNKK